jgi:hypothetical protein
LWRRATQGKAQDEVKDTPGDSGGALLPSVIALLAYALGPLVLTQPDWFVAAVMVVGILMLGEKPLIRHFSDAFPSAEGVTLAKFLIIAGLVLPLMPAAALPGLPTLTYKKCGWRWSPSRACRTWAMWRITTSGPRPACWSPG